MDVVVRCGEILTWSTVIMFFEGKLKLTNNDESEVIGQCSRRTFAFMEETKHEHLLPDSAGRNVLNFYWFLMSAT